MKSVCKMTGFKRIASLFLALVIVLSLVPLQSVHVHAAATLSVSKAEVELGEGILVTAASDVDGDWVGIYKKGAVPSGSVAAYYWYYVNGTEGGKSWKSGNTYNIFSTVADADHGDLAGLPTGEYDVVLLAADYTVKERQTVVIKDVAEGEKPAPSLTATKSTYAFGEEVRYTATSYKDGAWIGLYDETLTAESEIPASLTWQYIQGRNGTEDTWGKLPAGAYSIILFDDLSNYTPDAVVNFTVEEPTEALMTTDKQEYIYSKDMKIMVSVAEEYQSGGYWIGLYKEGEDPNAKGTTSITYSYTDDEPVNVIDFDGAQRPDALKSGTFDLWLLLGETPSYEKIIKTTITITAEIDASKTVKVDPTCTAHGTITYTYTDGSVKTVTYPEDPSLKKLDHDYTYTSKDEKHNYDCKNCDDAGTADCIWNEGVETKPATQTEKGEMTYTCTKCGGTKKVAIPALGATPTGKVDKNDPTCTKPGYNRVHYSDGTYKDEKTAEPLGHAYANGKHIDGTRTHTVTCSRNCGEPNATATQDCVLETNALHQSNALYYSCPTCGSWYESILPTNKLTYEFGEPIIVSIHEDYEERLNAADWIGIYKKGENPNANEDPRSFVWGYASEFVKGADLRNATWNDRGDLVAGEYTIYLCKNDGWEVAAARHITVVAKETERKTTKPTCTEDGYITAYYEDGTSKVVVTAADDVNLKATGHTFKDVKPSYNGAEKATHSAACKNGCGTLDTNPCQWDGGKVIEEATTAKDGKKEYTCSVCGGKKYEVITVKTVKETKKQEPTCENPGFTYNIYSDGTESEKTTIPALGHNWGGWKFDGQAAGTHSRTCANNTMDTCKQTESCDFNVENKNGEVTYTCKVCGGTFAGSLLYVPDKTLGVNDDIVFIPYKGGDSVWIGLYKDGESPSGSTPSLYWKYIKEEQVGTKLTVQNDLDYNQTRSEAIGNGTYNLIMFGDSGYTNILATETIEIFTDMSNTTWEIKLDGVKKENGAHTDVAKADLGTKVPLNVKVTANGEAGASWWGLYQGKHGLDTDFTTTKYYGVYQYVKWAGEEGITLTTQSQLDLDVGDYSIVLFEDGTYNLPIQVITFSITRPIASQQVQREATCEMPGIVNVVYEDDGDPSTSEEATIITDPLGHQWEKWTYSGNNSHTRKCSRNTGATCTQTEACIFAGSACTVCGGEQTHVHSTKKEAAVNPTCEAEGNSVYYTCNCGKWFSDAAATKEITDKASVVKPALGHKYGKWSYNAGAKTHTRTCGNNTAHVESEACTFDAGVLNEKTGEKKFTCTVCAGSYTIQVGAKRVAGSTRYTTALTVADQLKQTLGVSKFQSIVVACGTDFADALSGSYLANQKNAPILLVRNQQKELTRVKDYIKANLAAGGTVYLLGGEKAVPKAMETGLDGFNVKRLAGATRYDTNLEILKEVGTNGQEILVCTGKEFADGLSASAVNKPILLVKGSKLSDAQAAFLKGLGRSQFYIVGGENAVSAKMEKALSAYGAIVRINGATRYVTSANIAKTFFPKSDYVVMAYGTNFPDGLSGGPLAYSLKAPLLLVADGKQAPAVNYAKAAGVSAGVTLGGDKLISNATADAIVPKK